MKVDMKEKNKVNVTISLDVTLVNSIRKETNLNISKICDDALNTAYINFLKGVVFSLESTTKELRGE